jgi:hypothetical protein
MFASSLKRGHLRLGTALGFSVALGFAAFTSGCPGGPLHELQGTGGNGGSTKSASSGTSQSNATSGSVAVTSTGSSSPSGASSSTGGSPSSSSGSMGGSIGGPTSSSSSSGSQCPPGTDCEAMAPSGWHGPVLVSLGSGNTAQCPTGTSPFVSGGQADAGVADAAACECACDPPDAGMNPPACETSAIAFGSTGCDGGTAPCAPPFPLDAGCATLPPPGAASCPNGVGAVAIVSVTDAGCAAALPTRPVVQWNAPFYSCEFPSPTDPCVLVGSTAMARCTPEAPGFLTCIYQPNTVKTGCPPGSYSTEIDVDTTSSDKRICGDCTCGPAVCAGGGVTVTSDGTCTGASTPVPVNQCDVFGGLSSATLYAQVTTPPTILQCAVDGGAITGTVAIDAPYTFCCTN